MVKALEASGAEIVTVAVRRVNLDRSKESLLDPIDPKKYTLLPNTAARSPADYAVRPCLPARRNVFLKGRRMKIDFRVYLLTDRKLCPGGEILETVERALDGGVRAVQLREKELSGRELFRLAERMRKLTEGYGARLLINDRADVAMGVGADGVHLGVLSIPPREARRFLGPQAVIGCSAHNAEELREAEMGGADFVTFGPVYPTPSKRPFGPPVGLPALASACR